MHHPDETKLCLKIKVKKILRLKIERKPTEPSTRCHFFLSTETETKSKSSKQMYENIYYQTQTGHDTNTHLKEDIGRNQEAA
jgi:hypothetical protein